MAALVSSWRQVFSAAGDNATNPDAPFGIVSLASGGSEGHDDAIAALRWGQSGEKTILSPRVLPSKRLFNQHNHT